MKESLEKVLDEIKSNISEGEYDSALDNVFKHIRSVNSRLVMGGYLLYMKNYFLSEAWLEKTIEKNPKSSDSHVLLGKLYEKLENVKDAKKHYSQALELDPKNKAYVEAYEALIDRTEEKGKKSTRPRFTQTYEQPSYRRSRDDESGPYQQPSTQQSETARQYLAELDPDKHERRKRRTVEENKAELPENEAYESLIPLTFLNKTVQVVKEKMKQTAQVVKIIFGIKEEDYVSEEEEDYVSEEFQTETETEEPYRESRDDELRPFQQPARKLRKEPARKLREDLESTISLAHLKGAEGLITAGKTFADDDRTIKTFDDEKLQLIVETAVRLHIHNPLASLHTYKVNDTIDSKSAKMYLSNYRVAVLAAPRKSDLIARVLGVKAYYHSAWFNAVLTETDAEVYTLPAEIENPLFGKPTLEICTYRRKCGKFGKDKGTLVGKLVIPAESIDLEDIEKINDKISAAENLEPITPKRYYNNFREFIFRK